MKDKHPAGVSAIYCMRHVLLPVYVFTIVFMLLGFGTDADKSSTALRRAKATLIDVTQVLVVYSSWNPLARNSNSK